MLEAAAVGLEKHELCERLAQVVLERRKLCLRLAQLEHGGVSDVREAGAIGARGT